MSVSPLVRSFKSFKTVRNRFTDRFYRGRPAAGLEPLLRLLGDVHDKNVCFSIAFNTPWVIDYLTRLWARYVPETMLVIADNSSAKAASIQIRELCERRGVPYLKLPWNPEWNPNRSHGIAANWIFYNIVRAAQPACFGLVDHDCFPIADFRLSDHLQGKKVYGFHHQVVNQPQWSLWAGFTFMNTAFVLDRRVDFKPWHDFGMDTGGYNWPDIYSHVAPDEVGRATYRRVVYQHDGGELRGELLDEAFLHVGGASYAVRTTRADYVARMQAFLQERYL